MSQAELLLTTKPAAGWCCGVGPGGCKSELEAIPNRDNCRVVVVVLLCLNRWMQVEVRWANLELAVTAATGSKIRQ